MPTLGEFRKLTRAEKIRALLDRGLVVDEESQDADLVEQARLSGMLKNSKPQQSTLTSWLGSKRKPVECDTNPKRARRVNKKEKLSALVAKCRVGEPQPVIRSSGVEGVFEVEHDGVGKRLVFEKAPGSAIGEAVAEMDLDGKVHRLNFETLAFCLGARIPARNIEALEAYSF